MMRWQLVFALSVLIFVATPVLSHSYSRHEIARIAKVRGGAGEEAEAQSSGESPPSWNGQQADQPPVEQRSRQTFLGTTVQGIKSQTSAAAAASSSGRKGPMSLKQQLEAIRMKRPQLPSHLRQWKESVGASMGPATMLMAGWFYEKDSGGLTLTAIYALSLLGSISGFHLFLYFITVGYATGIFLPVFVSLLVYMKDDGALPKLTILHSSLILLWAIRSAVYFLWREHINWPQLHEKIVEVNKMARFSSKVFCWLVYSLCYVTLAVPSLYRLQASTSIKWGVIGKLALGLQVLGLLLESVADAQKSAFKSIPGNRNQWCNAGLFRHLTFPNYVGELMFWYGTYVASMATLKSPQQWIIASLGVLFITVIIKGAISSLGAKQLRKYGSNIQFLEFQRTHGILGPKPFVARRMSVETTTAAAAAVDEEPRLVL